MKLPEDFTQTDSFFVDEKVNHFKFENEYKLYNNQGAQIGFISQELSLGKKLAMLLISKAMMPFELNITTNQGLAVLRIKRGWTFFLSKITIEDANGTAIGSIKQKFKLFKPKFEVFDASENLMATIQGNFTAWDFTVLNPQEQSLGSISKKWGGALKEIFTTADKYLVQFDPIVSKPEQRMAILASAITIDMVLKERK